jgi:hypothetical protein
LQGFALFSLCTSLLLSPLERSNKKGKKLGISERGRLKLFFRKTKRLALNSRLWMRLKPREQKLGFEKQQHFQVGERRRMKMRDRDEVTE